MVKKLTKTNISLLIIVLCAMLFCGLFTISNFTSKKQSAIAYVDGSSATLKGWLSDGTTGISDLWWNLIDYNIKNLIITNQFDINTSTGAPIDVSAEQNQSLYAYKIDNGDSTYNCVIYADVEKIYAPTKSLYLFSGTQNVLTSVESITFENNCFDVSNVIEMSYMFYNCSSLAKLDLSDFDTSKVTTMYMMFDGCSALADVDVSNFNTNNVTNMGNMFQNCSSLASINISSFKTDNVKDFSGMFYGCSALESLDILHFVTTSATDMAGMFSECSKLVELDLVNFDTSNVTNVSNMFFNCTKLAELNVGHFDTSEFTEMFMLFENCSSLTILDLSNWDTSKVKYIGRMFYGCESLINLNLSGFNLENLDINTNINGIYLGIGDVFTNCSNLKYLNCSHWNTSSLTDMSYMFNNLTSLETLNLSNWSTNNVIDMSHMFDGCSSLTSLDLSSFDTSKVTDMCNMFDSCSALEILDISSFDTSNVTNMNSMFLHCSKLKAIDVSKFNTSKVTDFFAMFTGCSAVEVLDLSSFDFSSVTSDNNMLGFIGINDTMVMATLQLKGATQLLTMYQSAVEGDDDATRIAVVAMAVQNLFGQTEEESQLIAQGLFNTSIKTIYAPVSINSRNISLPYNNNDIFVYKNDDTEVETAFLVGRGEAEELAIYPKNTIPLAKPETSAPSVTPSTGFVDEQLLPALAIGFVSILAVVVMLNKKQKYNI